MAVDDNYAHFEAFQRESNMIEGIKGVRPEEVRALIAFVKRPVLSVADLEAYVHVCQPDAVLRSRPDIPGVRVGSHIAPPSGTLIVERLHNILLDANKYTNGQSWLTHLAYEDLHPFTDGNGRSGRALWLWMHRGYAPLGFLHAFYYQTLENQRK